MSWDILFDVLTIVIISVSIIISAKFTITSNNKYREVSETDLILRLNDRIYESKKGQTIIELAKDCNAIVVDTNKQKGVPNGPLPHREVENFLNDVEMIFTLKEKKILADSMFKQAFSWVINLIVNNKSIMDFIELKQKEFGAVAWKPITDYYHEEKLKKN